MNDPTPAVYGSCPACGSASLYLGDGGHITCSSSDCPRPQLADELLGEIGDARQHGAYTFCPELVGHVNMTAFAKKISEKRIALSQRDKAADYAHQQKQRADSAEATIGQLRTLAHRWQAAVRPGEQHPAAAAMLNIIDGDGPSIAECAANDRNWDLEKTGE
ncbi:hypothetical protein ACFW2I_09025 [Streptomyces nigra]|uniref:hypothetical protein n=1 Tax=Streptomyces nigra TaxID=1827580 RepID=UPI003698837F